MESVCTQRLRFRHWAVDDAEVFLDIYRRDEVARGIEPPPRKPLEDVDQARGRIERWRAHEAGLPSPMGLWAVCEIGHEASPIGTVLLHPLHDEAGPTDQVEIGWHLHPRSQGQGFATEAAQAVLAAAAAAGQQRVLALTMIDNLKSQAVVRRLGMTDDGLTSRWFGLELRQFSLVLGG
ncbi:MAG: GNAT family N-acetyltransferase [Actinomycetales bacterium]|nr:GNAT family N-acetyltransferase [Actinomycetales bacterium]